MGRIANVKRVTESVGGREITFRSLLEYRYCVWLQLQKEQGYIAEWWYEPREDMLEIKTRYLDNVKLYLPDFIVENNEGEYEIHECKGYFTQASASKLRLAAEQYENPITLIFANLPANSRNSKTRAQRKRAEGLEWCLKRIIYNANRDIFKPIKGLF